MEVVAYSVTSVLLPLATFLMFPIHVEKIKVSALNFFRKILKALLSEDELGKKR